MLNTAPFAASKHLWRRSLLRTSTRYKKQTQTRGVHHDFTQPAGFAFGVLGRLLKYSVVGCMLVGGTSLSVFEGAHMWVEHRKLAREDDPDVRKWEWHMEADRWSGGDAGGTDPKLGSRCRHTIRAAWMAQNWGTGATVAAMGRSNASGVGTGSMSIVDPRMEYAQDFLSIAIALAVKQGESVAPTTLVELLTRDADILERVNSHDSLLEARARYERAWAILSARTPFAARIASKLGDINVRLGENDDGVAWWVRSMQLLRSDDGKSIQTLPPAPPLAAPASPFDQRTLTSILVSLSAYYSASPGNLKAAKTTQEVALSMLRSIPPPESISTASPPEALHALFLLHRSSLLSIHHAEVLYGLRNPEKTSIQWLISAAESSERVINALTGTSQQKSPKLSLLAVYSDSNSMHKSASALLRDARRSAAEAWNLIGVLSENVDKVKASECYEKALRLTSVRDSASGGYIGPWEGVPEAEWKTFKANYSRLRTLPPL